MKALLSLLNQNHPDDVYGWPEIHVLAWNYCSHGAALCAVRDMRPDPGAPEYLLQAFVEGDLNVILYGTEGGSILYLPTEPADVPFAPPEEPVVGTWQNLWPRGRGKGRALVYKGEVIGLCCFNLGKPTSQGREVLRRAERQYKCKIEDATGEGWFSPPGEASDVWYLTASSTAPDKAFARTPNRKAPKKARRRKR